MPEVPVVKEPKGRDLARWFGFDAPLFRGNFFTVSPFALMRQFTEEMDRFFTPVARTDEAGFWTPTIEVKQEKGKLLVTAELPGLGKDDVKVHIDGDTLVLEGERRREKEEEREGVLSFRAHLWQVLSRGPAAGRRQGRRYRGAIQ